METKNLQQKNLLLAENLHRMRRTSPHRDETDGQEGPIANYSFGDSSPPRDLAEKLMREHGVSRARAHEMIKKTGM